MSRLLVIEDETDLREEMVDWLTLENYEVIEAANGVEGVQRTLEYYPDLIICDISMPELDGYGVLLEVQSNPTTFHIPFIFVTAYASREDIRYGMSLGADDYITKPFTRTELLNAIVGRLHKKAVQESLYQQHNMFLQQALHQAQEQHQLRNRMVAMFSHDFRNPLSMILASNSLLRNYSHRMDADRRLLHLNRIEASTRQLLYMLDEMMLVAQAENGVLVCQADALQLEDFMKGIVEELQFVNAETHTIIFKNHFTGTVMADPRLIRQILVNLVSNAVKYSAENTEVKIGLNRIDHAWVLEVQDQGIGIPEEDIAHLFTAFQRGTNVGTIKGTGLGLAIVKQAVELHQGKISVKSQVGVGSTFSVEIPIL